MATKERLVIESLFKIADKEGADVPFLLNPVQANLDSNLTGRDLVPKARQKGVSAYALARYTAACLSVRNTRAVVISHETDATQRMLARVHYYLDNIRGPKAVIRNKSKNEITFPKTNSHFYIGTAGAKRFGRGDTITHLHCSEVAFWTDPLELVTGLLQAVPITGEVMMESTGNGQGNYYHRRCMRAAAETSQYRCHFYGWLDDDEYRIPLTQEEAEKVLDNLDPDLEEDQVIKFPGITAEHIVFRRNKLEELDYDLSKFKQEYPLTLDECFQASGAGLFSKIIFLPTPEWRRVSRYEYRLDGHPDKDKRYTIGADVSAGVGKDRSVAQVTCLDTCEQVAKWKSDRCQPDDFGSIVLPNLGREFNEAFITVEKNNHGILTLSELRSAYPWHLIYTTAGRKERDEFMNTLAELGVQTSAATKPYLIGALRKALASWFTIHCGQTKDELNSFVEKDGGKLEAEEGCFDDEVIALAMAIHGWMKAEMATANILTLPSSTYKDPFSLDAIIEECQGRAEGQFLISSQVGTYQ